MKHGILTLNAGSSSLKFAVFALDERGEAPLRVLRGQVGGIGSSPRIKAWNARGEAIAVGTAPDPTSVVGHKDALDWVLDWVYRQSTDIQLIGVGHRVVHGGRNQRQPALVTPALLQELDALCPLAPHHQPHNLSAIRAVAAKAEALPQVACFDTAFHANQPDVARRLPLPRRYREQGLMRYGFHGLSYEYIVSAVPAYNDGELPARLIAAHLGNGASLCAIEAGVGIATTMGFSTLDGIMMGTRCGAIDPGVLLHLMHQEDLGESELSELVYNQCGLLGVSGLSSDMQVLLGSADPRAAEAVDLFCYSVIQALGSLIMVMQGTDGLVFTGGIGEHAAAVRASVCRRLHWLGLLLDESANDSNGPLISAPESSIRVWVIPTDEELVIARHSSRLLQATGAAAEATG